MVVYILVAILAFGLLIFIHELGHFLTAKACGVQVNEFSIGMGPVIFQRTRGETAYSLRCIPMGGYCAMEGEDEDTGNPRAFVAAPVWKRFLILIAGSSTNFVAGFLILAVIFATAAGFVTPRISGFLEGSTLSEETGLQVGDEFYRIDGKRVYLSSDVSLLLSRNTTGVFDLEVRRNGDIVRLEDVPMTPREFDIGGVRQLAYGLTFSERANSVGATVQQTWYSTLNFCRMVWMGLADLIGGRAKLDDLSGPVGIVSLIAETGEASETAADAAVNIAYFVAFLAVNLAVMNMLPIPALDGGRVFFLLLTAGIGKLTRKKVPQKYEEYIHAAGMILLLAFLAFITLKDIFKLFR